MTKRDVAKAEKILVTMKAFAKLYGELVTAWYALPEEVDDLLTEAFQEAEVLPTSFDEINVGDWIELFEGKIRSMKKGGK